MDQIQVEKDNMDVFNQMESEVRSYCRSFQTVFTKASNAKMWDVNGKSYIDFFAGAGALNYGHNDSRIRTKLIDICWRTESLTAWIWLPKRKKIFL